MIDIEVLKDKSENSLAKKIKDFQNQNNLVSKGTTIVYNPSTLEYVAFFYYNSTPQRVPEPTTPASKKEVRENYESSPKPSKKPYKERTFSPETLEKWKDQDVTEGQKKVLLKRGVSEKEIKIMSKLEAYNIIKNTNKGSI